jgi:hypothetical protein
VQWTGQWWTLTPSVFVRARREGDAAGQATETGSTPHEADPGLDLDPGSIFICPDCAGSRWQVSESEMHCLDCDARWEIDAGIYDFKNSHHR